MRQIILNPKPCQILLFKPTKKKAVYKGMNNGKSQKEPFTNSFVILFQNEEDQETVFWLAYSLWKSKFWHQSLIGSVIPFLRIQYFKGNFASKVNEMLLDFESNQKDVNALR
ncbi:DUF6943 family protein [Flavobacterium yafengii]|uniref:DUF6943 family protein n=1 Tax=Flavobacterium yafengii TaxID=3041253 RepID=UPI003D15890E